MSKLCLSTYGTILNKCKSKSTTQKKLMSTILKSVAYNIDESEETKFSKLLNGNINISRDVLSGLESIEPDIINKNFKEEVQPLLEPNKLKAIINALNYIIANDSDINSDTIIDCISGVTKEQFIQGEYSDTYLSGIFIYILKNTDNRGTENFAAEITDDFIIAMQDSGKNSNHKGNKLSDDSRRFLVKYENRIGLLPFCQVARCLNPVHRHYCGMYTEFLKLPVVFQDEILKYKDIEKIEYDEITVDMCLTRFDDKIKEMKLSSRKFLYDGGKYFYAAIQKYADTKVPEASPSVFPRYYFSDKMKCTLTTFISDYIDYGSDENNKLPTPMDWMWVAFNLGTCDEELFVFWIHRFIISTCYCIAERNKNGNIYSSLDTIDESQIKTLEDMHYAAITALYSVFSNEIKQQDNER